MCKSGTVGNMGNVANVGTKNFQKNEKEPGAGPGEENEAKNVLVMQGDMKIQVPSEGYP